MGYLFRASCHKVDAGDRRHSPSDRDGAHSEEPPSCPSQTARLRICIPVPTVDRSVRRPKHQMALSAMTPGQILPSPEPVLLFDDTCGFCNEAVQNVLRHDKKRSLRFASLRGEYGIDLRARHPELNSVDSMVWF